MESYSAAVFSWLSYQVMDWLLVGGYKTYGAWALDLGQAYVPEV